MVQATPLRLVAFERRVILDAGYINSACKHKNSFLAFILKPALNRHRITMPAVYKIHNMFMKVQISGIFYGYFFAF